MRNIKSRIGGEWPSFCWHCNKQLQRAPGKGLGLFYFHIVIGPDGHEHRVHGGKCLRGAVEDGSKYIKDTP